jgi:hypothetical protein
MTVAHEEEMGTSCVKQRQVRNWKHCMGDRERETTWVITTYVYEDNIKIGVKKLRCEMWTGNILLRKQSLVNAVTISGYRGRTVSSSTQWSASASASGKTRMSCVVAYFKTSLRLSPAGTKET